MSQRSKRELLESVQPRYWKARKAEKQKMLDEFTAATGFHRKYAVRLLKHGYPRRKGKPKGRHAIYGGEVVLALEQIWEVYGRICSKRLQPYLPEGLKVLERCGETTQGQYLNTLTCTDICTGWTEPLALRRHTQEAVRDALHAMRPDLPFPMLGIDSDNGSEFINDLLYRYCLNNKITFTRSRPYQKNDQAHVEQKNWSVVRHTIGYDRLETEDEFLLLQSIYIDLRLYINFFQPVLKLIAKERIGNKVLRRYDKARTPYQRILERKEVALEVKARLTLLYVQLNPVTLRTSIDQKVARLWKISK